MHIRGEVAECDSSVNLYALGSNRIHTLTPGRGSSPASKIATAASIRLHNAAFGCEHRVFVSNRDRVANHATAFRNQKQGTVHETSYCTVPSPDVVPRIALTSNC